MQLSSDANAYGKFGVSTPEVTRWVPPTLTLVWNPSYDAHEASHGHTTQKVRTVIKNYNFPPFAKSSLSAYTKTQFFMWPEKQFIRCGIMTLGKYVRDRAHGHVLRTELKLHHMTHHSTKSALCTSKQPLTHPLTTL